MIFVYGHFSDNFSSFKWCLSFVSMIFFHRFSDIFPWFQFYLSIDVSVRHVHRFRDILSIVSVIRLSRLIHSLRNKSLLGDSVSDISVIVCPFLVTYLLWQLHCSHVCHCLFVFSEYLFWLIHCFWDVFLVHYFSICALDASFAEVCGLQLYRSETHQLFHEGHGHGVPGQEAGRKGIACLYKRCSVPLQKV